MINLELTAAQLLELMRTGKTQIMGWNNETTQTVNINIVDY